MSVLVHKNTKVIVQGITGHHGSFHAELMMEYGTNIVAGVTPGKGGRVMNLAGKKIPVFNSVQEALKFSPADFSIIFVPSDHALEASLEALEENLHLVIITEHIPVHDVMKIVSKAEEKKRVVIGPNCPGIITPDECKIGIMPGNIFRKGRVGVLSRSGTLTYEIIQTLSEAGLGQSTVIGIGGDMVNGLSFVDGLQLFESDKKTDIIVLIGEIGGDAEERAAEYIQKHVRKKVVAYIAGKTSPPGKTMGHAGAIISGNTGTYIAKILALKKAGVRLIKKPSDIALRIKKILQ